MYEIIKDNKNLCVQFDLNYIVDHLLCSYEVSRDTLQQYVDEGKKGKTFYKQVITALNKSNSQKAYIKEKTKDYYIIPDEWTMELVHEVFSIFDKSINILELPVGTKLYKCVNSHLTFTIRGLINHLERYNVICSYHTLKEFIIYSAEAGNMGQVNLVSGELQYVDVGSFFYVKWKDTNIIQSLSHIKSPKDDLLVYLLGTPYEITYA